jgi:hypothetical protein
MSLLLLAHRSVQAQGQRWLESHLTQHRQQEVNRIYLSVFAQFIQCTQTLI